MSIKLIEVHACDHDGCNAVTPQMTVFECFVCGKEFCSSHRVRLDTVQPISMCLNCLASLPQRIRTLQASRKLIADLRAELGDRYDGAPDSPTHWMGFWWDEMGKVLR